MANNTTELLGVKKHANQHRLSRLIIESRTGELRALAEETKNYTDQLIAALDAKNKRIAELESRRVRVELPAEKFCPAEYAGSQLWNETEIWNNAIEECANRIERALSDAGIECEVV